MLGKGGEWRVAVVDFYELRMRKEGLRPSVRIENDSSEVVDVDDEVVGDVRRLRCGGGHDDGATLCASVLASISRYISHRLS